jgi:hypothetical protein
MMADAMIELVSLALRVAVDAMWVWCGVEGKPAGKSQNSSKILPQQPNR